jgi:hypothetical protein
MFRQKIHIVKKGDSLCKIARRNGLFYWPNLDFASGNNALRNKCQNPDLICPGNVVAVPPLSSVAPMEIHPKIIYRKIPLFTQSIDTCRKATGKMLFVYKNPGINAEIKFNNTIGNGFKSMAVGLP